MRSRFDEQLVKLNLSLIEMGAMVETAINAASEALVLQDVNAASAVVEGDALVDEMEKDIERQCLQLLLHQQPVARDLRLVSSALKVITDMERIGDQAADIAELTKYISSQILVKQLTDIPKMAQLTMKMVTASIDAYVQKDATLAENVIDSDDAVDALFIAVKKELINLIKKDDHNSEQAMDLLMVAKYFERIGDHAVNIARWVYFSINGTHIGK